MSKTGRLSRSFTLPTKIVPKLTPTPLVHPPVSTPFKTTSPTSTTTSSKKKKLSEASSRKSSNATAPSKDSSSLPAPLRDAAETTKAKEPAASAASVVTVTASTNGVLAVDKESTVKKFLQKSNSWIRKSLQGRSTGALVAPAIVEAQAPLAPTGSSRSSLDVKISDPPAPAPPVSLAPVAANARRATVSRRSDSASASSSSSARVPEPTTPHASQRQSVFDKSRKIDPLPIVIKSSKLTAPSVTTLTATSANAFELSDFGEDGPEVAGGVNSELLNSSRVSIAIPNFAFDVDENQLRKSRQSMLQSDKFAVQMHTMKDSPSSEANLIKTRRNSQVHRASTPVPTSVIRGSSGGGNESPAAAAPAMEISDACSVCGETVDAGASDELVVLGQRWHARCFCCGGNTSEGCSRRLYPNTYSAFDGVPYCKTCFREKAPSSAPPTARASPRYSGNATTNLTAAFNGSAAAASKQNEQLVTSFGPLVDNQPEAEPPSSSASSEYTIRHPTEDLVPRRRSTEAPRAASSPRSRLSATGALPVASSPFSSPMRGAGASSIIRLTTPRRSLAVSSETGTPVGPSHMASQRSSNPALQAEKTSAALRMLEETPQSQTKQRTSNDGDCANRDSSQGVAPRFNDYRYSGDAAANEDGDASAENGKFMCLC